MNGGDLRDRIRWYWDEAGRCRAVQAHRLADYWAAKAIELEEAIAP